MGCGSSNEASSDNSNTIQNNNPDNSGATSSPTETQSKEPPSKTQSKEPPSKTQSKEPPSKTGGNAFVDDAVNKHNQLRAKHGAPPMKSAEDLNNYSQKWANDIAKRDTMEHSKCTMSSGGRVGENIYCCWSSDPSAGVKAEDAVQSWYDEIKDYNFNNPVFSMGTGHFTQVVWKESVELGIAWSQAKSGTIYVVANYRPAGNMQGDFADNVLP